MHKTLTCVVFAILLIASFNLGQDSHPALYDAAHEHVLLVSEEPATNAIINDTI